MALQRVMQRFARWHIWLGWLVGFPILMWTVTGLVMVAKPVEEVRGVPSLPLAAVFSDGPRHFVFKKDATGFVRITVAIGVNNLERVEIRSGLKLGDEIALARPTSSREG